MEGVGGRSLLWDIRQFKPPPCPAQCVAAADCHAPHVTDALFQCGMAQDPHSETIWLPRAVPEQMHQFDVHSTQTMDVRLRRHPHQLALMQRRVGVRVEAIFALLVREV
eukprot:5706251-Prymnesium_polylepis.1